MEVADAKARAVQRGGHAVHLRVDADLRPVRLQHLAHRREVGRALVRAQVLHEDLALAVLPEAEALSVLLRVAEAIEELVRLRRVIRGPLAGRVVLAREVLVGVVLGHERSGCARAEEERFVDLRAVDAHRERPAEVGRA